MRSPQELRPSLTVGLTAIVLLALSLPAMAQTTHLVVVLDSLFVPDTVTVEPGDSVRWIWQSGVHTVTSGAACVPDGLFDAPVDAANPEFIWPVPGDYMGVISYFSTPSCAGGMTGRIRVDHLDWPAVFDPLQLLTVNLQMNPTDWNTIRNDSTLLIQVPALLWQDGDQPISVLVRRKSGDGLPSEADPQKVSLKIDINDLVTGQKWHELTKLSLENGDDQDVVREGMAWQLHQAASVAALTGYDSGYAAWVRLNVNGAYVGLYVNTEHRNKQALRNRGLFISGSTWLYKILGPNDVELTVGIPHSPTFGALCYLPFFASATGGGGPALCPTPNAATLAVELPTYVNMQGMLTMGAVNAFVANLDAMFTHERQSFYADFLGGTTRMYLPWDLDSVFRGGPGLTSDIYTGGPGSPYQTIILGNATFRAQYSQIMNDLICSPLSESSLIFLVDSLEPVLTQALAEDPNNQIKGTVADYFDGLRSWISQRVANVTGQIENFQPCANACAPDINGDGTVNVLDLIELLLCFGEPAIPGCQAADVNGDGTVEVLDLIDLLLVFGQTCP